MSQALNEIQELFNQSDADPIITNDLLVFLPILPEEVLEKLAQAFKEEPQAIEEFIKNFKAKFESLAGQQSTSFADIEKVEDNDFADDFSDDEDEYNEDF